MHKIFTRFLEVTPEDLWYWIFIGNWHIGTGWFWHWPLFGLLFGLLLLLLVVIVD